MYTRYDNSNREEYYEHFTFPNKISLFFDWQKELKNDGLYRSRLIFNFRNIEFGSSKKNVFEKNGKPRFVRTGGMFGERKHEIAFYKDFLNEHKLISQLHFIDDLFFYGCHTFRYLPRDKFHLINAMLVEKYVNSHKVHDTSKNIVPDVIFDNLNNQIRIVDNVFLNLIYLSGEEKVRSLIEEYAIEHSQSKKKNQRSLLVELYGLL